MPRMLILLSITLFISACTSISQITNPLDIFPTEHEYKHVDSPRDGSVNLFMYYPQSIAIDYDVPFPVYLDGQKEAVLRNKTYSMINIKPGMRVINVKGLNLTGRYDLMANKNYFLRIDNQTQESQQVYMGLYPGAFSLNTVKNTLTKKLVMETDEANSGIQLTKYIRPLDQQPACPITPVYAFTTLDLTTSKQENDDDFSSSKKVVLPKATVIENLSDADCELICVAAIAGVTGGENDLWLFREKAYQLGAKYIQVSAMTTRYPQRTYHTYARAFTCK